MRITFLVTRLRSRSTGRTLNDAFSYRLHEDALPLFKLTIRAWSKSKGDRGLMPPFDYVHRVYSKHLAVHAGIDRIYAAAEMVKYVPRRRSRLDKAISFGDWRAYHCFVYLGSAVGVFDVCLGLTNAVLELGIPERYCGRNVVMENDWVRDLPVLAALKHVGAIVDGIRGSRNAIVHRGQAPDLSAGGGENTELVLLVDDWVTLTSEEQRFVADLKGDVGTRLACDWARSANSLLEAVNALSGTLLPVYERHMKAKPSAAQAIRALRSRWGIPET